MCASPLPTLHSSRRGLRQLLDLQQHSLLSNMHMCLCLRTAHARCLNFSPSLTDTQTRNQTSYANSTCPLHTTATNGPDTHAPTVPTELPVGSSPAWPANLGKPWMPVKPSSAPISAGGALLYNTLSSFSAPGGPPTGLVDPSTDPSKGQGGPGGTSSSGTSSRQEPLLGVKKRSNGPVAVAISGGVDSAVAALLLKNAG